MDGVWEGMVLEGRKKKDLWPAKSIGKRERGNA
jgi:hypothetical protein